MGREFTGESAFVDAYSEYFDVVYREALRYSGNQKKLRRMPSSWHMYRMEMNPSSRSKHGC